MLVQESQDRAEHLLLFQEIPATVFTAPSFQCKCSPITQL